MSKHVKAIAFSCVHCPHQDPKAVAWLRQQIIDEKPDYVVCLGDLLEADAASRWPSEQKHTLEQEYASADGFLRSISDAAGDARLVFCEGNHDANILEKHRIPEKLRALCDYRKAIPAMAEWLFGAEYEYHRTRGVFRLGPVNFMHGYETSQSGMRIQAVTMSNPYCLSVWGHTHRWSDVWQVMLTPTVPLPYWAVDVGCLCKMDTEYMKRKRQWGWAQGCAVINLNPSAGTSKSPRMKPHWDCDSRLFRSYEPDLYPTRKAAA